MDKDLLQNDMAFLQRELNKAVTANGPSPSATRTFPQKDPLRADWERICVAHKQNMIHGPK
jgi:hypothetical protein